jgi:spore coat polysaccharide biosynthesis predicted glycosyltransferase SpsG
MPVRVRLVATVGPFDGRGHLGRALSLAEAMAERGAASELELLDGSLSPNEAGRAAAASLSMVAAGTTVPPGAAVVVDLPDPNVPRAIDPTRLLVIDDSDKFAGRAAVVVQPSQMHWNGPGSAETVLAGYDYVPISAAIRRRRADALKTVMPPIGRRVVVCFGGADPGDVTGRLVGALVTLDADVDVIIGPSHRGSTAHWPVTPARDPSDLDHRLARADLVVLGAGTMKFDAACLGRPAILLAAADDQIRVGPAYAAVGAAEFLGDGRTIEPALVARAVERLLADQAARTRLGARAAEVVDGLGADRIVTALDGLAS